MGQIGVARKVDPEEAIDTTARRGRVSSIESTPNPRSDPTEYKIDRSATKAREDSTNREVDDMLARLKGVRGINMRSN